MPPVKRKGRELRKRPGRQGPSLNLGGARGANSVVQARRRQHRKRRLDTDDSMFCEEDLTESWIDEEIQRTTCHEALFEVGPFDDLPRGHSNLRWKVLAGTEGKYDVALSLNVENNFDSSKGLLEQLEAIGENSFISVHLRQNFWINDSKGTRVICYYRLYAPDGELIMYRPTPCSMNFDEVTKGSWRLWNTFLSLHNLFGNPSVVEQQKFLLTLKIKHPADMADMSETFPYNISYVMGNNLCSPDNGNIRFDCLDSGSGATKSLYAQSTILEARCAYYARSMTPSKYEYTYANAEVFASSFAEGNSATKRRAKSLSQDSDPTVCSNEHAVPPQRVISMTDDFDVVHNILYYIYTNRITFSNVPLDEPQDQIGVPKICDAEQIYELAHRLCLESLQSKALGFLQRSCNIRNITSRVFSEFASVYEKVGVIYDEYFQRHWERVRETDEFKQHFSDMEKQFNSKEHNRIFTKFRQLMHDANFAITGSK